MDINNTLFRALVESLHAGVMVIGDWRILYVNVRLAEMLGYAIAELLDKPFIDFLFHDERDKVAQLYQTRLDGDADVVDYETALLRRNGRRMDVEAHSGLFRLDGRTYAFAVLTDITERKKAHNELKESAERFRLLAESAHEAICIVKQGQCLQANQVAADLFGYRNSAAMAGPMQNLFAPADRTFVMRKLLENMPDACETTGLRWDGTCFPMSLKSKPMLFRGEMVLAVAIIDLTERRRMEERIRDSEKMEAIGQLAGGLAHDFNNTLGGIIGAVEILMGTGTHEPDAQRRRECLNGILDSAEKAARLNQNLLAFSRKMPLRKEPLDVDELVRQCSLLLKHSLSCTIELVEDIAPELPTVIGDSSQLQSVLLNLAANARDAMPEGGRITLSARLANLDKDFGRPFEIEPGAFVCISVADTGCGIPPDVMPHIYEPFFTTKEVGRGTGLGLAGVYGMVKDHKGCIQVKSEVDSGSTIEVYLPTAPVSMSPPDWPDRAARQIGRSLHVLFADDEEMIRNFAHNVLEQLKADVTCVRDGTDALNLLKADPDRYDLVILDVIMPGMNGHEVLRAIKALRPDLPVLIISGYGFEVNKQVLLRDGAAGLVQKPFRVLEFVQAIEKALGVDNGDAAP